MARELREMGAEGYYAKMILDSLSAGDGRFRELEDGSFSCPYCGSNKGKGKGASKLVRIFVGPSDEGDVYHWFLISASTTKQSKIVPVAFALEVYDGALYAQCRQCSSGYAFFHESRLPFYVVQLQKPVYDVNVQP